MGSRLLCVSSRRACLSLERFRQCGRWGGLLVLVGCSLSCLSPRGAPLPAREGSIPCSPAPSAAVAPVSPSEVPPGCDEGRGLDVLAHTVELSLELSPPSLVGSGAVRVRARQRLDSLRLDARRLRIASVSIDGDELPFHQDGERLCVPLVLAPGDERVVHLAWSAAVDADTPRFTPHQVWAGYLASAWMPTLQDPAQRATLNLRLSVPASWRAIASGRRQGSTTLGDRGVHTFVVDQPSPPFLFAFAAGHLEEATHQVDGVTSRALGPPGSDLDHALRITAPMFSFLRERTGRPYPADAYGQVFLPGEIAQEGAAMALLSTEALRAVQRDPTEDWVFAHELAHQWFGWLVPCADFDDFWLNEGFATFFVAAYKEQRWGRDAYEREVSLWRQRSGRVSASGREWPVSLHPPDSPRRRVREADLPPRGVTYARGALVLHRLRRELGDELFWDGVRRYVADRAGHGATSDHLRLALQAASGRDLTAFFQRWVYAAAPDL